MGKRARRIPSWPGVIHSNKGRIHLRRPTCDILAFRLRRSGGPYIPVGRRFAHNSVQLEVGSSLSYYTERLVCMSTAVSLKAQQSAVTRRAILDACLKLFARHGFSTTSIDDIASAAGITKGAVYWHFENKEELFQAILEEIRAR